MKLVEQLTQINAAITAIEAGAQEYTIGNRKWRGPELSVLYSERRELENKINSGSAAYFVRFEGR